MTFYIFTDTKGKLIEMSEHENGHDASVRRKELKQKLNKHIISWCHMGSHEEVGVNPEPII